MRTLSATAKGTEKKAG